MSPPDFCWERAAAAARADIVDVLTALGGGPDDPRADARAAAVWRELRLAAARPAPARARRLAMLYDAVCRI